MRVIAKPTEQGAVGFVFVIHEIFVGTLDREIYSGKPE